MLLRTPDSDTPVRASEKRSMGLQGMLQWRHGNFPHITATDSQISGPLLESYSNAGARSCIYITATAKYYTSHACYDAGYWVLVTDCWLADVSRRLLHLMVSRADQATAGCNRVPDFLLGIDNAFSQTF